MSFQNSNADLEELERFLKKLFNNSKLIYILIAAVVLIAGLYTSFYTIQPDEEGVVLRFGKYHQTTPPGLHAKLPFGIDKTIKVKTKLILQEEFGFRTSGTQGTRTSYSESDFKSESIMLTGDLNVADVEWITQFQIAEPQKFLFNIREPIRNIRDISEAVMRRVVGDRLVNDVLTVGRTEIALEAKELTQEILNSYNMGIKVVSIKLQDVNPPEPVKPSFNRVNEAKQEQEKAINQAEKYYNKIIPEARGKAEQKISEAKGFAEAIVNRAKGDAERFQSMLVSYKKAPQVTKDRMYIETVEKILSKLDTITVIDPEVEGLLPIYNNTQGGKYEKK
ncbi:MAG: FtsH protease activity modulator HflK [Bdellovibrionales bacterium]|nr:FtsH protease activity modulator HflK [Bdellovibrionales bacterium]